MINMNINMARVPSHRQKGLHVFKCTYPNEPNMIHLGITATGWILDVYIRNPFVKRGKHNENIKKSVTEDVSSSGVHQEREQQAQAGGSAVKYIAEATLAKHRRHDARLS